jgi:hypothetical protein
MSVRNYSNLTLGLADNSAGDIGAEDVRSIVETFSNQRTIGTYTNAALVTSTSFSRAPVTQYGSAVTNGVTWTSNYVTLRDNHILPFEIFYRVRGNFSTQGTLNMRLVYGLSGAAPTTLLDQSELEFDAQAGRYFTLFDRYEIPAAGANTTIALEWKTEAVETFNDVAVYLVIRSLNLNYGGV